MTAMWTWQILAQSLGEWVAIITLVTGSGLAGTFTSALIASRRLRVEKQTQQASLRTVAAEEAESAVRIMGEAMKDLRLRAEQCEEWRREHLQTCPRSRRDR
jgi:hypothetical protein